MITGVKQDKRHTVDACVNCLLQGGEPSASVERQVDMMGSLVREGRKEKFWRRKRGGRAHTSKIGRRKIGYRPVDFDRARERIEGGKGALSAPARSRTAGGGYKCNTGCPGVPCTEDCFTIILELLSAGFSEYGELIRA